MPERPKPKNVLERASGFISDTTLSVFNPVGYKKKKRNEGLAGYQQEQGVVVATLEHHKTKKERLEEYYIHEAETIKQKIANLVAQKSVLSAQDKVQFRRLRADLEFTLQNAAMTRRRASGYKSQLRSNIAHLTGAEDLAVDQLIQERHSMALQHLKNMPSQEDTIGEDELEDNAEAQADFNRSLEESYQALIQPTEDTYAENDTYEDVQGEMESFMASLSVGTGDPGCKTEPVGAKAPEHIEAAEPPLATPVLAIAKSQLSLPGSAHGGSDGRPPDNPSGELVPA